MSGKQAIPAKRRRPAVRRIGRGLAVLAVLYLVPVSAGWMGPATPTDILLNLAPAPEHPALRVAGPSRVVVLHGIARSRWSMWRLARALRAHGHDVLNHGYPSTTATLEEHAAGLAAAIEARWGDAARRDGIAIVGHSMGGMVAMAWLRRVDAVPVQSAVFLGVPIRGAVLADLRREWWLYRLLLGTQAGRQLSPGAPIHRLPTPWPEHLGRIAGGAGDGAGWHPQIPGDDDGTVAVAEALAPLTASASVSAPARADGAATRVLPLGHTHLTFADAVIHHVLTWLKFNRFPPAP